MAFIAIVSLMTGSSDCFYSEFSQKIAFLCRLHDNLQHWNCLLISTICFYSFCWHILGQQTHRDNITDIFSMHMYVIVGKCVGVAAAVKRLDL